ncbi:MAG: FecR domain-containing protein [Bacteriovoracaceae bacterium]
MRFLILIFILMQVVSAKEIKTHKKSIVMDLGAGAKIGLGKNSKINIVDDSTIELIKGKLRLKSDHKYRIVTKNVSFKTEKSEFEVSVISKSDIELNVYKGEVEASSPLINTFVPEIIKENQGLIFSSNNKSYVQKKFEPKLKSLSL